MKNRNLSLLPALTAVAFVMAARGAFAGKVVALLRGLRRSATQQGSPNRNWETVPVGFWRRGFQPRHVR